MKRRCRQIERKLIVLEDERKEIARKVGEVEMCLRFIVYRQCANTEIDWMILILQKRSTIVRVAILQHSLLKRVMYGIERPSVSGVSVSMSVMLFRAMRMRAGVNRFANDFVRGLLITATR